MPAKDDTSIRSYEDWRHDRQAAWNFVNTGLHRPNNREVAEFQERLIRELWYLLKKSGISVD